MVDPRRVAILVQRSGNAQLTDVTSEVAHYRVTTDRVLVRYRTSTKEYPHRRDRAAVLDRVQRIPVSEDHGFAIDGVVWPAITEAYRFAADNGQSWWRFFSGADDRYYTYTDQRVSMIPNAAAAASTARILAYWRAVAATLPEEGRSLRDAYRAMTFVHPESALHRYLERLPIDPLEPAESPTIYPFRTNLSQRDAIENALGNSVSVIDGPPGTGKTQTILNLIANLVTQQGKTVAVVSSNNAAVDNVYDKLVQEKFGFLAANLGRKEKKVQFFAGQAVRNQAVEQLCAGPQPPMPAAQELTSLDKSLRALFDTERERAQSRTELHAYELEFQHFQGYFERQEMPDADHLPVLRWSAAKILDFIVDTDIEATDATRVSRVVNRVKRYFRYRSLREVDPGDVDIVLQLQWLYYEKRIAELTRRIAEFDAALRYSEFEALAQRQRTASTQWLIGALRERYGPATRQAYELRSYRQRLFKDFTRDYPVILSTCHSLPTSLGAGFLVDYLIIDEASQVDLLAAGVAMAACRNLVVVGDLRQLAHIPNAGSPPSPDPAYDYQQHSILSSLIEVHGSDLPRAMLREHYRCAPDIIEFCNQQFYRGELIPYTSARPGDSAMVVVRTAPGNHMRQHTHGIRGRSNQREVDVIQREVLPQFCADFEPTQIGITTPYRKQVSKVADALISAIEADTVHKYQGREKDAMVMTTVIDETWRGQTGLEFADDPQLVNVAVSRAKHRFVLVTNHDMLPKSRNLNDLIGYIRYRNIDREVVDSEVVSVFDLLYRDYARRLRPLAARIGGTSKFRSENIIAAVLDDLVSEQRYGHLSYRQQLLLKNLFIDTGALPAEQARYVKNRASVDFGIYNRVTKRLLCAIEVDGFKYHEDSPAQLARDGLKDAIFTAYGVPLIRLPTTGSAEIERLRTEFAAFR
ncbi:AAA domain-containing protein [Nocardia salmonicida]|uniref:AAA domain-containing protein n=1 Tax=Nocardia salmonicida TaxID=53431 RepID=UPI0007A474B7|nr:AAA domain-containing protein [Nocardia salmonicida]